ncbi:MAG TPA: plastocyanin/azurin family copper-binding protein [Gemmatimonadaceae bacterium]|nr:plastocyanin/azurin family copper-binding protein [Gemmatimonadaceae bacterium]
MRFFGLALAASAFVLGACGGGDNAATTDDTTSTAAAAEAPAAGAAAATGTATAAPVTGEVHEVKMLGDAQGYRFEPAELTVKPGDGVKFIMVSGGPHNVSFTNVPDAAKAQLQANIPNPQGDLTTAYVTNPNEEFTISFANVPAGTYNYTCVPHSAMNMHGVITVQQ